MKHKLVVGDYGVVSPRWWWLRIGLDSLVVVGLLLVWVDWFVCVWSLFGQLGPLMILAWVFSVVCSGFDGPRRLVCVESGFSLRFDYFFVV